MYKFLALLVALVLAGAGVAYFASDLTPQEAIQDFNDKKNEIINDYENSKDEPEITSPEYVLLDVPFFSQAPTANWDDPRQQDGCEEASILMAHLWLTGGTMTVRQAEDEIIALSEWQKTKYGEFIDRSITDTGKMFQEYYGHADYEIRRNITVADIKDELMAGNLVIVPTNGQILDNPNYTAPGPLTHMLPIIGYDDKQQVFITNDPGTRNGRQFKFGYDRMIESIYDYQTGAHVGYEKTPTVMMVVTKN